MAKFLDFEDRFSFKAVPSEPSVPTTEFLQASDTLVGLFEILGSTAFGAVISDLNGNIKKVRDRQTAAPDSSKTLQDLATIEYAEKKKKATATEGLMWLLRGLDFTAQALRHNLNHPTEELATSFQHSYNGTLKQYHNFVVKGIFSVALKATPYRNDFYEKIGANNTADPTQDSRLTEWLDSLETVVHTMQKYYTDNGITF